LFNHDRVAIGLFTHRGNAMIAKRLTIAVGRNGNTRNPLLEDDLKLLPLDRDEDNWLH
jgi:hypothetical protein